MEEIKRKERGKIDMGSLALAIEGEIVTREEEVEIQVESNNTQLVSLETHRDERNEIEETKTIKGVTYMKPTKWIYADDVDEPVVSPKDKETLAKIIYEELGQFNSILAKLNWHISCKRELLRWIRNNELNDDIMVAREGIVDESEVVLKNSVRTNDVDSAKFVLKTVGKKRGWSEKEVDDRERNNIYAYINVAQINTTGLKELSDADLTKLLEDQIKGV